MSPPVGPWAALDTVRRMDPAALRAQFPVLERVAYLNAGTCGPVPRAASAASADIASTAAENGRTLPYFEQGKELAVRLRAAYAARIGARPQDVALTTATSDGMVRVLLGLGLRRGDEVVTAEDEHPGLLGPLAAAERVLGIRVVPAAFDRVADAVGPQTKLVACSHVNWCTGAVAPAALAEVGRRIPVLLDGAQGAGAIRVDVEALGCAFYAAAGQKWLCGPVGTGLLWIAPAWRERLAVLTPTYLNLAAPGDGLRAQPWPDARALDTPALSAETMAAALAAHDVLDAFGWAEAHTRAISLADRLARRLTGMGRTVSRRDETTLVAWEDPDAEATAERLAKAGIAVRHLPGGRRLRASVGAWNDDSDLDRLLTAL
jgi:L-cysteine/cystine lyase